MGQATEHFRQSDNSVGLASQREQLFIKWLRDEVLSVVLVSVKVTGMNCNRGQKWTQADQNTKCEFTAM